MTGVDDDELAAMERALQEAVAEFSGLLDDPAALARAADRATDLARLIREEAERRREIVRARPLHAEPGSPRAGDDHAAARLASHQTATQTRPHANHR